MTLQPPDEDLDLPFDTHYCPPDGGRRGAALVVTTDPAFPDDPDNDDRQQADVLAVLEADNADKYGDRATELATFVVSALNAYVRTPVGRKHWASVHPLMAEMRNAGRQ